MKRPGWQDDPLDSISNEQWEEYWNELRLHIQKRYPGLPRIGRTPAGIASDVLISVWNGDRPWPPIDKDTGLPKDIKFIAFLCEIAWSHISHIAEQSRRFSFSNLEFLELQSPERRQSSLMIKQADAEDALIHKSTTAQALKLVEDDKVVYRIVKLLCDEPDLTVKEIAKKLALDIKDVQNAKKRLRRRLKKLRGKDNG